MFDPLDPYPLLMVSYEEEKRHSEAVDRWLGLRVSEVESSLRFPADGQERWEKKGASVFLTPYSELRRILTDLAPSSGETVVDLGAGYGRMAFVLAAHFPGVNFYGIELVPERVDEGRRGLKRHGLIHELVVGDLLASEPPRADYYFLYDYGTRAAIEKTLGDLRELGKTQKIVLVGRGRGVRDAVERSHPWLGAVAEPWHQKNYSIYRSS